MTKKQKLELTWIGKENRPKLEPRILLEDPAKSYHARSRVTTTDSFDNRLIFGDNLLALKALEDEFSGKVKCVFIDPPYNTGSAFTHYDDGVEHSIWLSLMRDRLEIIRRLLSDDGSLWITIDDNEAHYLKVLCDEVFGRANFLASIAWQKVYTSKNSAKHFSAMHDHLFVFAKNKDGWSLNQLPRSEKQDRAYNNPDNDPRGPWKATPLHARNFYSLGSYQVTSPKGIQFSPPPGRYWAISRESFDRLQNGERIWWGKDGTGTPNKKSFLSEVKQGVSPSTMWFYDEAGHNAEAKNEINALALSDDVFITPKPEKLIKQVLTIASNPNDLVLDSFAGSGTTGAVAH
ncbi:MAG: site-specific DNA-methyltransferase, partial [Propionivibrio sp.]